MFTQEAYTGKWRAKDLSLFHFWNGIPDGHWNWDGTTNYSIRTMIYHTPDYWMDACEEGIRGTNADVAEIQVTVNVEEGIVFLNSYQMRKAKRILMNKEEVNLFIQNAQKLYDEEHDMGKNYHFICGVGENVTTFPEYDNPNIEYLPIVFPDTEKFRIVKYREKVEWSLLRKGAVYIMPKEGKRYLAVIQRKNKPRDLSPFKEFLGTPVAKETPAAKEICFCCRTILGNSVTETDFYVTCNECYKHSKEKAINRLMSSNPCFRTCYKLFKMLFGKNRANSFMLTHSQRQLQLPKIPASLVARQQQLKEAGISGEIYFDKSSKKYFLAGIDGNPDSVPGWTN